MFLNILKSTTTQSAFILLWADLVQCSLKYKILNFLIFCPVFLDLPRLLTFYMDNFWEQVSHCNVSIHYILLLEREDSTLRLLGAIIYSASIFFLGFVILNAMAIRAQTASNMYTAVIPCKNALT